MGPRTWRHRRGGRRLAQSGNRCASDTRGPGRCPLACRARAGDRGIPPTRPPSTCRRGVRIHAIVMAVEACGLHDDASSGLTWTAAGRGSKGPQAGAGRAQRARLGDHQLRGDGCAAAPLSPDQSVHTRRQTFPAPRPQQSALVQKWPGPNNETQSVRVLALTAVGAGGGGVTAEGASLRRLRADAIAAAGDDALVLAWVGPGRASPVSGAEADAVRFRFAARVSAGAAVGGVDGEIDARTGAARLALPAGVVARAAVVVVCLHILDALAVTTTPRSMALRGLARYVAADPTTEVATRSAVVGVGLEVAGAVATAAGSPPPQSLLHAPQWLLLVSRSLHLPLQSVKPVLHWQTPPWHSASLQQALSPVHARPTFLQSAAASRTAASQEQTETGPEEGLAGGAAGGGEGPGESIKAGGVHGSSKRAARWSAVRTAGRGVRRPGGRCCRARATERAPRQTSIGPCVAP